MINKLSSVKSKIDWDPWIWSWKHLADHGVGPFAEAFVKPGGLCPKCNFFPAGGGCDEEFVNLCCHCWDKEAQTEDDCPLCTGLLYVEGAKLLPASELEKEEARKKWVWGGGHTDV